jgi:hypothetical protein
MEVLELAYSRHEEEMKREKERKQAAMDRAHQ